jgi:hypothetical protein
VLDITQCERCMFQLMAVMAAGIRNTTCLQWVEYYGRQSPDWCGQVGCSRGVVRVSRLRNEALSSCHQLVYVRVAFPSCQFDSAVAGHESLCRPDIHGALGLYSSTGNCMLANRVHGCGLEV